MLLHDRVGDRESQARALADLLCREERIENPASDVDRHAGAVVADLERHGVLLGVMPGADDQRAAPVGGEHRLFGVDHQVEQHLLDLVRVGEDLGQARCERGHDVDIGQALFVRSERQRFGHHLVEVDHRPGRLPLARERQQVADDPGRTVRLAEDDVHAASSAVIEGFLGQALRPAQDRGERVVELVCDT